MEWITKFVAWLKELFTPYSPPQIQPPAPEAPPEAPAALLKVSRIPEFDERSADVGVIQSRLNELGYGPLTVDGWFYNATRAEIAKFQKARGLEGTGLPGPKTMALLGIQVGAPVVTPPSSGGIVYNKLSWENGSAERAAWTKAIIGRLEEDYEVWVTKIQDGTMLRSDWNQLTKIQRINALAEFFVQLFKYESGWNPKSSSVDVGTSGKKDTYSVGLGQVSVVDQDWCKPKYASRYTYDELLDGVKNIDLTMSIMGRQVIKTGLIFLQNSSSYRYWAVALIGNKYSKVEQITAAVKKYTLPAPQGTIPPASGNEVVTLNTPEWMDEAEKYLGKSEHDSKWSAFLGAYWPSITKLTGMGNSIVGNWRAWCALFFGFILSLKGYDFYKSGLAAEMGANTGKTIEYRINGAPRGAGVWKQTNGQNHICFLSGNCTAGDLTCKDCTFNCTGGNQGDEVSKATYKVADIKRIFWPTKKDGTGEPFPGKVTKSINCTSGKTSDQSTR